jgi:hypothetical protein
MILSLWGEEKITYLIGYLMRQADRTLVFASDRCRLTPKQGAVTISKTTLRITTLGIRFLKITTFSITTISITILSKKTFNIN